MNAPESLQRHALRIGLIYAALAAVWLLGADRALASFELDPAVMVRLQIVHHLAFVALTAAFLYRVILHPPLPLAQGDTAVPVVERTTRLVIAASVTTLVAVILGHFAYSLPQQRGRIQEFATEHAENLARVSALQVETSVGALDATLNVLAHAMRVLPGANKPRDADVQGRLLANLEHLPQVRALWILDAKGDMIHDSEAQPGLYNVSDRDYFKVHRDSPDRGLFIEPYVVGRADTPFMAVSRRITLADGSFGGVAVAAVEPRSYEEFYASLSVGESATLSLLSSDATLIASSPVVDQARGAVAQPAPEFLGLLRTAAAGHYRARSGADGLERIFAYRKLGKYPLVVLVGLSEGAYLAQWRSAVLVNGSVALALSALVGWFGFVTLRELSRHGQVHRELDATVQRLKLAVSSGRIALAERDLRSNRVHYSSEWKRQLGYEDHEISDEINEWRSRIHPEEAERVLQTVADYEVKPWPDFEIEFRLRHKDGSYRSILSRASIERDAQGRAVRLIGTHIDITERKAAELALRESDARYRATFEQAAVGIAHVGLDGRWLRINKKLCDIVGYSAAELELLRFQDITHPQDLDADLGLVQRLLAGEMSSCMLEKRYLRKGGEVVWIQLAVALVRSHDHEPLYFISVVNDIDDRHRVESALAQAQGRLEAVVASAMDAIISVDDLHRVVLFNPAAEAMFGWAEAAMLGQPLSTLLPDALRGLNASRIRQAVADGKANRRRIALNALRGQRADGSWFPIEASISSVQQGSQRLFTLVLRDVSERDRIEKFLRDAATRYRQLFDGNPHPMWIRDARSLACLQVNDAALRHFGYSRDEFLALSFEDLFAPEQAPALRAALADVTRTPSTDTVWQMRTRQGELIEIEITWQRLEIEGHSAVAALAQDVSEQRRTAQQVLESREALRALLHRLNRAQEEERVRVAREVHDELGQLLTGLKMDLRWIERRLTEPGLAPQLLPVLDRVVAAAELNDLTISTVQKLAAELRPGVLDQLGLPAALAQRVRQFRQRTGLGCTLHCAEELAALPNALASELFYICQEALTNITRHAQAQQVLVNLDLDNGTVRLQVEDDGIGADLSAPALTGSLGLLGMRERARHHGGTITLESVVPHGLRVVAVLPWPVADCTKSGALG